VREAILGLVVTTLVCEIDSTVIEENVLNVKSVGIQRFHVQLGDRLLVAIVSSHSLFKAKNGFNCLNSAQKSLFRMITATLLKAAELLLESLYLLLVDALLVTALQK